MIGYSVIAVVGMFILLLSVSVAFATEDEYPKATYYLLLAVMMEVALCKIV